MSRKRPTSNPRRKAAWLRKCRERDGDDCRWCGQPIDFGLPREHPGAYTFDHIRAHADGGVFNADNVQLMHRQCNEAEGQWEALARKWQGLDPR